MVAIIRVGGLKYRQRGINQPGVLHVQSDKRTRSPGNLQYGPQVVQAELLAEDLADHRELYGNIAVQAIGCRQRPQEMNVRVSPGQRPLFPLHMLAQQVYGGQQSLPMYPVNDRNRTLKGFRGHKSLGEKEGQSKHQAEKLLCLTRNNGIHCFPRTRPAGSHHPDKGSKCYFPDKFVDQTAIYCRRLFMFRQTKSIGLPKPTPARVTQS